MLLESSREERRFGICATCENDVRPNEEQAVRHTSA